MRFPFHHYSGFGRVLGEFWEAKVLDCRIFVHHFFDAKFGVQVGRAKNRKKMLQNDLSPYFGVGAAICATLGGRKKDRGKATWHELGMNSWPEILAMLLRNASLELEPSIWHARPDLRSAADSNAPRIPPGREGRCDQRKNRQAVKF